MKKQKDLSNQEFETTVLEINPEKVKAKLRELGAQEKPEVLLRRWVFDIEAPVATWIRLRDNGDKTTLTFKKRGDSSIGSTQEIEVIVSDFDKTAAILSQANFYRTFYQENQRQIFTLSGIEFSIDSWPKIPPYLEIEADSIEKVKQGLELLGLEEKDSGDMDVAEIFTKYGVDLHSFKELRFDSKN